MIKGAARTWSINDVDLIITSSLRDFRPNSPITKRSSTLNRNALLPLELHTVHLGTYGISPPDFVDGLDSSGIVQDAFRQCSLARIDMR